MEHPLITSATAPPADIGSGEGRGKIALVLSGGGIPGWMYEIGCLTALDEFFEDGFSASRFDIYVGTSAGAVVASLVANGVRPRTVYDAIVNDERSVYNFSRRDIYTFGTRETWPMIRKILGATWPLVRNIMGAILRNRGQGASIQDILYMIQEGLPSGIFTLRPLERLLRRTLAADGMTNDFRRLHRELYIPAVDLDLGEYRIFGTPGFDDMPISRAAVASAAVPILFQPVRIRGRDYIDGGVGRVANMDVAVSRGATCILVINPVVHLSNDKETTCLPTCYGLCRGIREKGLSYIADQAMRVNTSMRLKIAVNQLQTLRPDINVMVVEPDPRDTFMFIQNVMGHDNRREALRHGYQSMVMYLTRHFETLQANFGRHGIQVALDRFRWRPTTQGMRVVSPSERFGAPSRVA